MEHLVLRRRLLSADAVPEHMDDVPHEVIPYSQFLKLLDEKKIVELTVHQERITGRLKEPINGRELFITNWVEPPALAEQIEKSGAKFTGTVENTFLSTLLSWLMPRL
jgi:cell division protease FtsH